MYFQNIQKNVKITRRFTRI